MERKGASNENEFSRRQDMDAALKSSTECTNLVLQARERLVEAQARFVMLCARRDAASIGMSNVEAWVIQIQKVQQEI